MGHLHLLQRADLFDPVTTGYETDIVINCTDADGHTYARLGIGVWSLLIYGHTGDWSLLMATPIKWGVG